MELDEQDEARVLPVVAAANIYASISRVGPMLDATAMSGDLSRRPNPDDLKLYFTVKQAQQERDA